MASWNKKRCVIIDDNETNRIVAAEMAETLGLDVVAQFHSGYHGLGETFEEGAEVILLDWRMPNMDGVSFLEYLRDTAEGRKMKVIIYSATEGEEHSEKLQKAGADGFIPKPITLQKMEEEFRRIGIL